jgi:hypothetical protein
LASLKFKILLPLPPKCWNYKHELNALVAINFNFKKILLAGHWWLTPIILATQETEIRRISVQSQPCQIIHKTLS